LRGCPGQDVLINAAVYCLTQMESGGKKLLHHKRKSLVQQGVPRCQCQLEQRRHRREIREEIGATGSSAYY
jgi:hypothetical protein